MVLVHVGYPKAGSTTLQTQLFAMHPDIINLSLYPTHNIGNDAEGASRNAVSHRAIPYLSDPRIAEIYRTLTRTSGLAFDASEAKRQWQVISADYQVDDPVKPRTTVLSHESITSGRFSNPEVVEKARRIRAVFGEEVRILIMIRAQGSLLTSLYRDHPFDPRTLEYRTRPVSFPEWLDIDLGRGCLSVSGTLLFDKMTRVYEGLFGEGKVLVMPLELLRRDLPFACSQLSRVLNINFEKSYELLDRGPANTGISAAGISYRKARAVVSPAVRWLRPFKKPLKRLDSALFAQFKKRGPSASIEIPERSHRLLRELYADDNARLAQRLNLPLAEMGYET